MIDAVILTEQQYVNPEKVDWYIQQILDEDRILQEAIEAKGLTTQRVAWDDTSFDWSNCKCAIFRATWDYFHRFAEFSKWLDFAKQKTKLINPPEIIHWNIDKHYLLDLENKGIRIVPTSIRKKGNPSDLKSWCEELGGNRWVLKPTISGAARHTYKIDAEAIQSHETIYRELIDQEDFMLQPFQNNVMTEGEISLMVMNGRFTHAIQKIAKKGDFRVQDDFGGSVHSYSPSQTEIEFAEEAARAVSPLPLYARVDVMRDNEGEWAIGELELIEPELWFRESPGAATVFADGLLTFLQNIEG